MDDVVRCIFGPVAKVATGRIDYDALLGCFVVALALLFEHKVLWQGVRYYKWPALRGGFGTEICRIHKSHMVEIPGIDTPAVATSTAVAYVLATMLEDDGIG